MSESNKNLSRRHVLKTATAAAVYASTAGVLNAKTDEDRFKRKIKLGVIGCGGRGSWIANLFKQHGGYEMHAVADYFQHVADKCGDKLGVSQDRRFSGLSGYKKLIASGVEAVALETPPYFFPQHAESAVQAGLHVYMAKPVAVDVPGCMKILDAGKQNTKNNKVFRVDYQIPTDPNNIKAAKAVHEGKIGPIAQVATFGIGGSFPDPPKTETIESRLQKLIWVNDIELGCDYIGNFDIHALDAALWAIGQRPVAASGFSRICRANPHGNSRDVCSVVYKYANGIVHNHFGEALRNNVDGRLSCRVYGQTANALIDYWGNAYVRGGKAHFSGPIKSLYSEGAKRNIAEFYNNIVKEDYSNKTLQRSVDGALTAILGREAAARGDLLTMDELIKENKKLEVDLTGLKS